MLLKLEDMRDGRKVCIDSASIQCFYPEGKEGTVICFEVLDERQELRGIVMKVRETFHDIFETLQACGEAVQAIRGRGLPEDRRDTV